MSWLSKVTGSGNVLYIKGAVLVQHKFQWLISPLLGQKVKNVASFRKEYLPDVVQFLYKVATKLENFQSFEIKVCM